MQYISSDTNVWIDFALIHRLDLPFRLGFTYCMSSDAITKNRGFILLSGDGALRRAARKENIEV